MVLNVSKVNILKPAAGGHVGHFCIWTESAFHKLDELYYTAPGIKLPPSAVTTTFPLSQMLNTNLSRILKSPEIQKALQEPHKIHQSPEEESTEKPENQC